MTDIKHAIRQFVLDNFLFGKGDDLKDDASFLDAGIIDSTGVLQVVAFLEDTYHIEVSDAELIPEHLDSIDAIAVFVARKQASLRR